MSFALVAREIVNGFEAVTNAYMIFLGPSITNSILAEDI